MNCVQTRVPASNVAMEHAVTAAAASALQTVHAPLTLHCPLTSHALTSQSSDVTDCPRATDRPESVCGSDVTRSDVTDCPHVTGRPVSSDVTRCDVTDCPRATDRPESVCGSDGRTYRSWCELRLVACSRGVELTVVDDADCSDDVSSGSGGKTLRHHG